MKKKSDTSQESDSTRKSFGNFTFYQVPKTVITDNRISSTEKLIYSVLLSLSRSKGYSFAKNSYIGRLLNCSDSTISNGISKLNSLDYVSVKNPKSPFRRVEINVHLLEISEVTTEESINHFGESSPHNREVLEKKEKEKEAKIKNFRSPSFNSDSINNNKWKELKVLFSKKSPQMLIRELTPLFDELSTSYPEYSINNFYRVILNSFEYMKGRDISETLMNKTLTDLLLDCLELAHKNRMNYLVERTEDEYFQPDGVEFRRFVTDLSDILRSYIP